MPNHILFKTGDNDAPSSIKYSSGEVALEQCRVCGKVAIELEAECQGQRKKHYADRDAEDQGDYYMTHLVAMTEEGLNLKSDIAAELAHRDIIIHGLETQLREK